MDELEKQLEVTAPILRAAEATAQTPPESAIRSMNVALAQKFNQASILSEALLRLFILQMISESPMDGFQIVEKLTENRVALKIQGDGVIYGLLSQMENTGALQGRWRESEGKMAKIYQLTEKGTELLRTDPGSSVELSGILNKAGSFGR